MAGFGCVMECSQPAERPCEGWPRPRRRRRLPHTLAARLAEEGVDGGAGRCAGRRVHKAPHDRVAELLQLRDVHHHLRVLHVLDTMIRPPVSAPELARWILHGDGILL
jgi:hypothetical protein